MARLPIPGSDDGNWGNILNDYLLVGHNADGTAKQDPVDAATDVEGVLPIVHGGTGSSTKNFVDLVSDQTIVGNKTFDGSISLNSTIAGRNLSADGAKLDGIESSADVTDATNVAAAGAVMSTATATTGMQFVVDEDAMTSNSATKLPTQQSVKAYVDSGVSIKAPLFPTISIKTATTDTLTAAQHGHTVRYSNAAQVVVTLPTDASEDLPDGFWALLFAEGAGGLSVNTTGITLVGSSPFTAISQNEVLFVMKTPVANTWMVIGGTT